VKEFFAENVVLLLLEAQSFILLSIEEELRSSAISPEN
jgi:hypothetical protein